MAADFGILIVKEVCSIWGYKSELEELNETVSTIQKVLHDAEAKRELSNEEEDYIEKLKDAVYDADDLFDEFRTLAELKQLRPRSKRGKLFEKVRCFFSSKNQVGQAYRMSREVKEIKKRLDAITNNHEKFGFSVDYKPMIRRREETCSYADANEIIGREKDKEAILDILLNHNNADEDLFVLTIVGVGGLGKTTLAQLVYNDEKVKEESFDLRLWVSVSDQDGQRFDVKAILSKILEFVTHRRLDDNSTMELVQNQFQEHVRGKKYFLVLDDIWNEDREHWLELKSFLLMGQGGSKIVITTRSEITSMIVGHKCEYKLDGLSKENSWHLFEMSAFHQGHGVENYHELVEVGKRIIKKCYNIPLAIKVVGSLLFGHNLSTWRSVEESGLAEMRKGHDKIMSILKLSYHNLESSLKSCFSYCAVFPKNHRIEKQMLIDMWIAHGYVKPLDGKQNIEDAAEEHFLILLRRCFFQNVEKDIYGDVCFLKIHDLMHDVAQEMGRKEISAMTSMKENLKVRHVGHGGHASPDVSLCSNKIRSYISHYRPISQVVTQLMCLRVLTLTHGLVLNLPDSIGKLMLLRYLNLSYNNFEVVCDSITKLHNLESIILSNCKNLKELPNNFGKLVKLRHLNLKDCDKLTSMPLDLTKLCSLRVLPFFVVGKNFSTEKQSDDELQPLKFLTKIKGKLHIEIGEDYRRVKGMNDNERGYLNNMEHLSHVTIKFPIVNGRLDVNSEALLQDLEPHPSLKGLELKGYKGATIPKWGRAEDNWATSFPCLVSINLQFCCNLQQMPMLSKLSFLKSLILESLPNIEYMENASSGIEFATFFPLLEVLHISFMKKLKGWWKGERFVDYDQRERFVDYDHHLERRLTFPRLHKLSIVHCPNLTSFFTCPSVGELELHRCNNNLRIRLMSTDKDNDTTSNSHEAVKLWKLSTDKVSYLKLLPTYHLTHLYLRWDPKVENQPEAGEALPSCASSLRSLSVDNLKLLRAFSGINALKFKQFTALQSLSVNGSVADTIEEEEEADDMMLWKSFPDNLHSLKFRCLMKMTTLPRGMQYLTSLQSLTLNCCCSLGAIPEWINCLSSLQSLCIYNCRSLKSLPGEMRNLTTLQRLTITSPSPDLVERCKAPHGEDYPKIQHIPKVVVF